jgi:hypothetical protein
MSKYNTNLASEFHVLSVLHRLGLDAMLTLGNKKMVDIVVTSDEGELITIDVKGIAKKYDWPADNIRAPKRGKHFIILVSYEGQIEDPTFMPNVWIIPYNKIRYFTKEYQTRKNVSRPLINNRGDKYLNAWDLLIKGTSE